MVVSWLSIQFLASPSLIFCRAAWSMCIRLASETPIFCFHDPPLDYSTQCDLNFTRLREWQQDIGRGMSRGTIRKVAVSAFKCGLLPFSTYRVGGALLARPVHGSLATELTGSLSFADCNAPGLQLAHDCCL
ncbi:hypothetical protein NOF04DRAFT_1025630 [Fusarium oxysporum II5]|nr:hypothetical protein NOF04DRAFT_1025630 [Fusarium oxysporum II5]